MGICQSITQASWPHVTCSNQRKTLLKIELQPANKAQMANTLPSSFLPCNLL